MTILEARKILGKCADDVSDEQLEKDIEIAELLKNLFFECFPKLLNELKIAG